MKDSGPGTCCGPIYPNQECGDYECVPAAVSNSLGYLQSTTGEPPSNKSTSIGTMKDATGWVEGVGCGEGWADDKDQYMQDNGYNVNTDEYPDPDDMGHEATEADCDAAMQGIADGKDVEINGGHHCAMVVGMSKITEPDGTVRYAIQVSHDTKQDEQGGCQTETIIYTPPQNGNPSDTQGGTPGFFNDDLVNGFVAEDAA